ncbi:Hypothetical protein, putative [Bodo saltans]|uniref:KNTC1 N-terminal domain-containing protein n=1 Tax=Bodo saltans TaxID=75058 RepID=A0A0S4JGL2_BODSA|nr:Hypothetical protein, putative [Bodo saltans]|eukprot:CUG88124.1 Hypothetical protein, putative [Bodo saltans]
MRSEPLHVMDALPCDIKSMIFIGTDRLGVLTLLFCHNVYDLRTFRLLQTMIQSTTGENSGTVLDSSSATIMRSGGDAGGCLQYHPVALRNICCLRSPVQYAPAALVLASGNGSATSQLTLRSATKKSAAAATKQQQQQSGDATQQKPSTISPGISPRHAALPRHPQRVIGLAYQRHTQTLYSIDGDHLFLWNVANGECNAWSNVGKAMQMTSCTWAGSEAVRLVTGTQVGAILTWSPSGTSVLSVDAVGGSAPSSSSTDVSCCATSGSHVLVAIGNKAHLITYDTSMVLADGNRRTTTRTLTLDSPASIMSVCFLRETALVAIGTVDAVLHLCNLDSMKILETQRLKDREGRDEVSSVESIILLQRRKQNVALLLLEDGAVNVYHLGKRAVVFHARLFRKHEARFHAACVSSHEERLYVGDSLGRMFVYDIGSITSSTDFKITAASLANPCIKYLYHTQATLDGLTSMISVDVGQIASTAAYGSSAMMRDNSYQQHNSMYPSSAAATAPATPMNTLTSGMSYYQHPAHNNHHHHHHNSGTSMTLGVNHLNANNNLNSSTSTPSLAYSLLPPVSVTVDAIVVGCGDGHIRCFAASHTEAIHVGTLGDPIYGRWDWTDASTFAAEMLPKMEKDTFDDASEAFLDDILREATKKQTADTAAEVSAAAASPPSSPHRNGGGNNMSNALVVVDGENAKQQPLVTTTTSPSGESDAATSHPTASTYHQHRTPQRGRASVTKLPAVPAAAAILSKSVSPRKTVVVGGQQQQQQQGPPLTPPSQETSPLVVVTAPIIVTTHHAQPQPQHSGQQLHVRKRFIKPADIDLGNGRFITDHATEKKLLLLHYDNNHFAQQIMNSNNSYSTRSCDQSALMALPPSSYSAGGGRPPGGGAAGPKILLGTSGSSISGGGATCVGGPVDHNHNNSSISPSSPFQLSNAAEHNFFITSLAVSMEHESGATPALHSEGVGGLRGVVVPTTSRPQQQQQQQHRRSIDSSVDGQSTQEGLSPLTPGIGLLNPRQPNTKQQKGHHHGANSVQSSRSLVAERTLVPTHTVHLFDTNSVSEAALVVAGGTTTTTKQSSTAATDPQIEGVNSSASLGTTVDDSAPLPLPSFAGDHPLPPRTVGSTATGSGGGQQRRASNARRRSNAESTLSLMYRVNSTITIDMPSTPLPPPMPPTSEGGHTDEETARHHTRALLQQMAYRLDRVRPRGSMEGRFGRRVDRLYETAEEKKNRQTRRKEYLQRKQQGGVAVMGGVVSSDDEDVKVGSGGEDNEPSAGALGIVATLDGQVSLPLVLPAIEGAISSPLSAQPAGGSGHQEGFYDDMEDEDEEDDDDILASIRSPQTAKNILAVEEKLRLYKKARETGPAMAVIAQGGGGAQGTGGASSPQSSRGGGGKKQPTPNVGGFARGDPAWLTRVSSQLVMQDVSFTIPSTQVQSMGANGMLSPQRGGGGGRGGVNGMLNAVTSFSMQSNAAGGGGGKTALANTGSGAGGVSSTTTGPTSSSSDRTGSLHRGISLFGFHQPPAPPNSAPGTSRRRSTVLGGTLPAYAVTGPTPPKTAR